MLLQYFDSVISERVAELSADAAPFDQRNTYGKAFLQVMILWTQSEAVKELVFGKRVARNTPQLMGTTGCFSFN